MNAGFAGSKVKDRYDEVMSLDDIARTVGAEQLIYVQMTAFKASPDGFTPRPAATCLVKVWDAVNKTRVFPGQNAPDTAYALQVATLPLSPDLYKSRSSLLQVYQILAEETGTQVAKLFYAHEIQELGSQSDPARHYN